MKVYPKCSIEVPLTLEKGKRAITMVEEFVVIDGPLAYNTTMRRLAIHNFQAVLSTYH